MLEPIIKFKYLLISNMDIKFKNLTSVMTVLALLVGGLIAYYFTVSVGAISVGTVTSVGSSTALNLSPTMQGIVTGVETDFATNVSSANNVVPIVFSLVALVAIIIIFNFDLNLGNGKGKGGVN